MPVDPEYIALITDFVATFGALDSDQKERIRELVIDGTSDSHQLTLIFTATALSVEASLV